MKPLLQATAISVEAGGKQLIRDFSCTLHSQQILAITGPSGCGKTTLLRAVAQLITTHGEIRLNGLSPEEAGWTPYRRKVSYLAQKPAMHDESVEENLRLPFHYAAAERTFDRDRACYLLTALGLQEEVLAANARTLSVGEQQRICLLRMLLIEPQVMLLDEPTSALDSTNTRKAESLIMEAVEKDAAALLVSHHESQLERLAHERIALPETK